MKIDFTSNALLARSCLCIAILLSLPLTALAHAKMIQSQPKANETLAVIPRRVELWFSEPLEAGLNTIEVVDQTGKRLDQGDVILSEDNKKALVNLAEVNAGVYTVRWKALSADQHAMRGTFNFTVHESARTEATVTPSPTEEPASTSTHTDTSLMNDMGDTIAWGQTVVRWVSYLAMMILFGAFVFRLLVLAPALAAVFEDTAQYGLREIGTRCIVKTAWVAAISLLLALVVALVLQASDVFDKSFPSALSPRVLFQVLATGYGPSWLLQVSSLLIVIIILLLLSKRLRQNHNSSALWWAGLIVGAVMLAAPSWTGHAMLAVKHFRLAVITDWLHLVAGGFWVGGLFHLALTVKPIVSAAPPDRRASLVRHLIRSFTRMAMPSVALLLLAGLYNAWAHVPALRALWLTRYGQALAVKVSLVLLMLFLGAVNNYYFGKRAARLANENNLNTDSAMRLEHGFLRSVRFEATLGITVLLVTAILVFLTPARNHPAMDQAGTIGTSGSQNGN